MLLLLEAGFELFGGLCGGKGWWRCRSSRAVLHLEQCRVQHVFRQWCKATLFTAKLCEYLLCETLSPVRGELLVYRKYCDDLKEGSEGVSLYLVSIHFQPLQVLFLLNHGRLILEFLAIIASRRNCGSASRSY